MKYKQKAYKRSERKKQVVEQFMVWNDNGDTEPKTMYRIARALDMTPSRKFTQILLEMELEGQLTVTERDQSGRYTTRFYSLLSSLITEKLVSRRVSVKRKGQVVGSLEVPAGQMGLWS